MHYFTKAWLFYNLTNSMWSCICSVITNDIYCGDNKNLAQEAIPSLSMMLLLHFDIFCDQVNSVNVSHVSVLLLIMHFIITSK